MTIKQNLLAGTTTLVLLAPSFVHAETVETRIVKLELQCGYPGKATAEKLYDEMDFQRATQAFIGALPAVGFHALDLAHLNSLGAKDGDVVLRSAGVSPNPTILGD